jgi:hypothetical protein
MIGGTAHASMTAQPPVVRAPELAPLLQAATPASQRPDGAADSAPAPMYGVNSDPGVSFAYHHLVTNDWWNENSDSSGQECDLLKVLTWLNPSDKPRIVLSPDSDLGRY